MCPPHSNTLDNNGGWTTFFFHGDGPCDYTYHCICDPEEKSACDASAVQLVMHSENPIAHNTLESFSTFYSRFVFGRLGIFLENGMILPLCSLLFADTLDVSDPQLIGHICRSSFLFNFFLQLRLYRLHTYTPQFHPIRFFILSFHRKWLVLEEQAGHPFEVVWDTSLDSLLRGPNQVAPPVAG